MTSPNYLTAHLAMMVHPMTKLSKFTRSVLLGALLAGFVALNFATNIEAQVLTNRTPDKAKIQPTPTPTPPFSDPNGTVFADPLLIRPRPRIPKDEPTLAYYVRLSGVDRVFVSDSQGRTDDLFRVGVRKQVDDATYEYLGPNTVMIIVPAEKAFTISFEAGEPSMSLEILKGHGDASPEEAIRHNDLVLDKGRARLQLGATGVSPLRLDVNQDGRFESILKPTAHVRGLAARDKRGPDITFEVLERDAASILVAIKAVDRETGLKSVFYSTDHINDFPYRGPVRVNLKQSTFIVGIADDNAGNRTFEIYEFVNEPQPSSESHRSIAFSWIHRKCSRRVENSRYGCS